MTTTTGPTSPTSAAPLATRAVGAAGRAAFAGLLARDLTVLRKNLKEFLPRTLLQPFLLMFVFTYVFPKIGQGVGGSGAGAEAFTATLVAGVVGLAIVFQGIQAVALPLVQEFGYSKEIEDRVLAPLPTKMVGVQKIVTGMLNSLFAALLVFPIAYVVPATAVHLNVHWLVLLTLAPLAAWVAASLGLVLGTRVAPQQVSYLFALVVLINPLVYMCEGFRAALTNSAAHMGLPFVYGALILFGIVLTWIGVDGFERRTVS
jgi:ABC-2 type transport system permease protein